MRPNTDLRPLPCGVTALVLAPFLAALGPWSLAAQLRYEPPLANASAVRGPAGDAVPPQIQVGDFTVDIGFYVQPLWAWVDPEGEDSQGSFRVRRARLALRGDAYDRFSYLIQIEMAGSSTRLVDGWIGTELHPLLTVAAGQAKAPFGRQQLTSDTGLQFVDRGILDPRFNPARQPGVWMSGEVGDGLLTYSAGLFNGEGMNQANDDGVYLKTGRVVWNPLGPFALEEGALDFPEAPLLSVGAAALSTRFGTTGFTARRLGLETAFKLQGFYAVGEYVLERLVSDVDPSRDTHGWYVQAGYVVQPGYELAGRYGTIDPDVRDTLTSDLSEKGFALSRYFEGHDMKIQADYLRLESETDGTTADQIRVQWQLRI
jgi:hypothetical protein